jgi:glucose-6-phosphate-specific signal transduction histidine kinase
MYSTIIFIDAIINLIIGFILLLFPWGISSWLGLPESDNHFYPLILGAVIFGIGIALLVELTGQRQEWRGLGLQGAI